jgi:hypothetical protein
MLLLYVGISEPMLPPRRSRLGQSTCLGCHSPRRGTGLILSARLPVHLGSERLGMPIRQEGLNQQQSPHKRCLALLHD